MIHRIRQLLGAARQMVYLVQHPAYSRSYYPEEDTKGRMGVFKDLFAWLLKYRDVNTFYFFYGLDRKKAATRPQHVMPYKLFREIRDRRNQCLPGEPGYNYICLLRDKFVFSQVVSSLGFPTPKNLAILDADTVSWIGRPGKHSLGTLFDPAAPALDVFCKNMTGQGGADVYPLRVEGGKIYVQSREITADAFRRNLKGQYLLQERIRQHPDLSALHPHSINAIRLVTFNTGGEVKAFWAALKVGTGGKSVDNVACGGVAVRIDLATGTLRGDAMYLPGRGGKICRHPDTGVLFDGYQIPHFEQAVAMALDLHRYLYGIHSIGWDIAISETGPTFIEGNDDWAGHFAMAFVPEFKQRFLEMYN
jgi:hypothetical protein